MKLIVLEDVYHWDPFSDDHRTLVLTKGEEVYIYTGQTYGVCGPDEIPVTREPGQTPFFGVRSDQVGLPLSDGAI